MTKEIDLEDQLADEVRRGSQRAFAVEIDESVHLLVNTGRRYTLHKAVVNLGQSGGTYIFNDEHLEESLSLLFDTTRDNDGRSVVRFSLQAGDIETSSEMAECATGFALFMVSDITEKLSAVCVATCNTPDGQCSGRVIKTADQELIDFLGVIGGQYNEKF